MKKQITALKFLGFILFNIVVFSLHNSLFLTGLLILGIFVLLPVKQKLTKRILSILPIAVVILLSQLLFYPSVAIIERLAFGYIAAAKIMLISMSVLIFLTYTSLFSLVELFNFLPKDWLLLFLITAYLIPCILKETEEIKIVQKSRTTKKSFLGIAALIVPLLHRVFKRAEILSLVIVARGYTTTI